MRGWKLLAFLLVLPMTASTSFAAGFRLPEAGVKAMGMGFAFTAQADDPSAIYFNPAGITQLQGSNVYFGGTYVRENGGEFSGMTPLTVVTPFPVQSETQKSLDFFIPNAYYTYTSKTSGFSYGVGLFAPFGLGQEYQNASTSIFRNQITNINLQTLVVNPTIAYKVGDSLSIGGGIDFMYGWADLKKTPVNVGLAPTGNVNLYNLDLSGDGTAWGYNFGILFTPVKNLKIGASYRSNFDLYIKGADVDLTNINPAVRAAFGGLPSYSTTGSTTIAMPATFALGASYNWDRLTVEVDADWTFWHSFDRLQINIANPTPALPPVSNSPKNWEDVCALRIGVEYRVTDPLALRAGFAYDPTPVPAETMGPELPDANRLNYMLGAGYKVGNWTFDGAFMYVQKKDRTVNNMDNPPIVPAGLTGAGTARNGFNGTWSGDAWLAGLDIGYKF